MPIDLLDELKWRGLLHQCTDEDGLRAHLADPQNHPRKVYAGFDPTGESLTIGNLMPMMLLVHVARAGHTPVVVMGGGTGLIGDPSGKTAERQLQTEETVRGFVEAQRPIFESVFAGAARQSDVDFPAPTILNNLDWLGNLGYIEVLRDIGKHFSVNMMIQKDSVKARLEEREHGISYTEFSYMILQAFDFWQLFTKEGVSIQAGGSDQWGNIVAGVDLIRRGRRTLRESALQILERHGKAKVETRGSNPVVNVLNSYSVEIMDLDHDDAWQDDWVRLRQLPLADHLGDDEVREFTKLGESALLPSFGLTVPLVTKSDGTKFGKTESGAVWLSSPHTTPYAYHQFWLNASDDDVVKYLRFFTLLPREEIERLAGEVGANPAAREAQRTLAHHATALLHGEDEALACERAAKALFSGEIADLPEATLRDVLAEVPSSDHPKASLEGEGVPLLDLLVETGLAGSKRQGREFLSAGSVAINGRKVEGEQSLTTADLLHGSMIAIRRGKKAWRLTRWS